MKDAKVIFKILSTIVKVVLTIIIVCVFSVIIVQRVTNNKLTVAGYGIYTVITNSMEPVYNVSDMIIAKKVDANDLKVGDDVVYLGEEGDFAGKIITHRIEHIYGHKTFITKGINNDTEDPKINADQIKAKVIKKSTILSFLSHIVNNLYGFYFIVFVPIVLIICIEVIETVNEKKALKAIMEEEKKEEINN